MCVTKWKRRHVVTHALFDHWNLVPAAMIGLGPVFLAWWLVWMGLALFAVLVGWRAASPAFRLRVLSDPSTVKSCLPESGALSDPRLRETVAAIRKARGRAMRSLLTAPPEVSGFVSQLVPTVVDLEHRAAALVTQADGLDRFLADEDPQRLRHEGERLRLAAREAGDSSSRQDLVAAGLTRAGQLEAVEELRDARDRLGAGLDRLVALLEEVPARLMRLQALDARAKEDLPAQLTGELRQAEGALHSVEQLFGEVIHAGSAPAELAER